MHRIRFTLHGDESREEIQGHIDLLQFLVTRARTTAEIDAERPKFSFEGDGVFRTPIQKLRQALGASAVTPIDTLDAAASDADHRNHELHEASPLKAPAFTPEEIAADDASVEIQAVADNAEGASAADEFPFVAAVGASSSNVPPVPPVPTLDSVKLDADGLPWDDRIHSSNHKFDAQGRWWKRRGVQEVTRKAVEAELKLLVPGILVNHDSTAAIGSVKNGEFVPTPPPVPAAPPVPPAPPQASFPRFVTAYMKLKLPAATCRQTLVEMGIEPPEFPTMAKHPDRWAEFASKVGMGWLM